MYWRIETYMNLLTSYKYFQTRIFMRIFFLYLKSQLYNTKNFLKIILFSSIINKHKISFPACDVWINFQPFNQCSVFNRNSLYWNYILFFSFFIVLKIIILIIFYSFVFLFFSYFFVILLLIIFIYFYFFNLNFSLIYHHKHVQLFQFSNQLVDEEYM